jgi:hypothetical protein
VILNHVFEAVVARLVRGELTVKDGALAEPPPGRTLPR